MHRAFMSLINRRRDGTDDSLLLSLGELAGTPPAIELLPKFIESPGPSCQHFFINIDDYTTTGVEYAEMEDVVNGDDDDRILLPVRNVADFLKWRHQPEATAFGRDPDLACPRRNGDGEAECDPPEVGRELAGLLRGNVSIGLDSDRAMALLSRC